MAFYRYRGDPAWPFYFLLNFILTIIEGLLAFRVLLRFFGANPFTPFVQWIYQTTQPLVAPFFGIFPTPIFSQQFAIDFAALFAMVIYALIGYLIKIIVDFAIGDGYYDEGRG